MKLSCCCILPINKDLRLNRGICELKCMSLALKIKLNKDFELQPPLPGPVGLTVQLPHVKCSFGVFQSIVTSMGTPKMNLVI